MRSGGSGPGGNNPKWFAARRYMALELWEDTAWTVAEIAEFIGVSAYTVQKYLRDEEEDDASRPATPVG